MTVTYSAGQHGVFAKIRHLPTNKPSQSQCTTVSFLTPLNWANVGFTVKSEKITLFDSAVVQMLRQAHSKAPRFRAFILNNALLPVAPAC